MPCWRSRIANRKRIDDDRSIVGDNIMTVREYVNQTVELLDEAELAELADYLAYLRFRARSHAIPPIDAKRVSSLYAEAEEEDRILAETGMVDYAAGLAKEDSP
jgi:hypothetical protein